MLLTKSTKYRRKAVVNVTGRFYITYKQSFVVSGKTEDYLSRQRNTLFVPYVLDLFIFHGLLIQRSASTTLTVSRVAVVRIVCGHSGECKAHLFLPFSL